MKIKRYVARTTREAMAKLRAELGADAIVLKNQEVADGVEILAMADAELAVEDEQRGGGDAAGGEAAMSTVNFEAYVRERQQRRSQAQGDEGRARGPVAAAHAGDPVATDPVATDPVTTEPRGLATVGQRSVAVARSGGTVAHEPAAPALVEAAAFDAAAAPASRHAGVQQTTRGQVVAESQPPATRTAEASAPAAEAPALRATGDRIDAGLLMSELRAMRGFLSDRIESVSWFEGVRRRPAQSRLLRRLLNAGFSATLARMLADHLPADFGDAEAGRWLSAALRRNLRVEAPGASVFDAGGVFALLGPTGVGKTTTAAKIAAQFAVRHGAQSVGLITADVYRIGAQDQLRTFGRLLGVPVHVAHDVSMLADLLHLFRSRKLVLIDTAGVGQRDERVGELLAALSSPEVRKVVVLNAAMQAEAIEEVVRAYQARRSAGVVVSKVDEAVQLGGLIDCLIRHKLPLQGIANGQRVPEDWHRPDAGVLVDLALAAADAARATPFDFDEAELAMLMSARLREPAAASAMAATAASASNAVAIGARGV